MSKIAYLFGAGASANALPVINQMPDRILEMANKLPERDALRNLNNGTQEVCDQKQLEIISKELRWLHEMIGNHATIDTLMKKMWIQNRNEFYKRLNYITAAYFVLEQYFTPPDKRYDTFWASLIDNRSLNLPDNISILSWNYDSQFEMSFLEYSRCAGDLSLELGLNYGEKQRANPEGFSITKLNGTALPELSNPLLSVMRSINMTTSRYVYENYLSENKIWKNSFGPLQYAWSLSKQQIGASKVNENYQQRIHDKVSEAEVLVVIGYSFPFFNRAIDKMIIGSMPNLKKIYFQDIRPDNIRNAFKTILSAEDMTVRGIITEGIEYTDQFFLPPEL